MIIVGLESCPGCKLVHEKYPDIPYVVIPRITNKADKDVFEVKKAIGRLGIDTFPVLLNDALNKVLPLSLIDPNLK